jgi:hypothetical protein
MALLMSAIRNSPEKDLWRYSTQPASRVHSAAARCSQACSDRLQQQPLFAAGFPSSATPQLRGDIMSACFLVRCPLGKFLISDEIRNVLATAINSASVVNISTLLPN